MSRDCLSKESKEQVQGSKSSWCQRLKPRDYMVTLETSRNEKGCASSEKVEADGQSAQPDSRLDNTSGRPLRNLNAEASSTSKSQKTVEVKISDEVESVTVQEKLFQGFSPWVNKGLGPRCEAEKSGTISIKAIDTTTNGLGICDKGEGNPHPAVSILPKPFQGSMRVGTTTAELCKPVAPPRRKLGLPPRPPCHKVTNLNLTTRASFPDYRCGGEGSHQVASAGPVLETQCKEVGKHGKVSFFKATGASFQSSKVISGKMSNSKRQSKVPTDGPVSPRRTGNGCISCERVDRPAASDIGIAGVGSFSDVATGRLLDDAVPDPACKNVIASNPNTGFQANFIDSEAEIMNGSSLQNTRLEVADFEKSWQPLSTGALQNGKKNVIEDVAHVSTSATSPWEVFIEPAGASKIAREQFAKVYNSARDELKSRRCSQTTSSSLANALDGGFKLALGTNSPTSDAGIKEQSMKHGQQMFRQLQPQKKSSKREDHSLLHRSIPEKRDTLTVAGGSQSKQTEGFQISEGPVILRNKAAINECHVDVSIERMPNSSVVQNRDLRTSKHNVSASNPGDQNRLVFSPGQEIKCADFPGPGIKPVLGKRIRVTFEDHGDNSAVKKVAACRPLIQSKPHLWLQRWYSTVKYSCGGLSVNNNVMPDGKKDSDCPQSTGLKKLSREDCLGVSGPALCERVKWFDVSSSKVLPSAAAMAIVGTAARQFCASQHKGKGSFAFWSGFGMQTYRSVEPLPENGNENGL